MKPRFTLIENNVHIKSLFEYFIVFINVINPVLKQHISESHGRQYSSHESRLFGLSANDVLIRLSLLTMSLHAIIIWPVSPTFYVHLQTGHGHFPN